MEMDYNSRQMDPVFPIANEIDHLFDRQALFYVV